LARNLDFAGDLDSLDENFEQIGCGLAASTHFKNKSGF